jgi:hypothetical protein
LSQCRRGKVGHFRRFNRTVFLLIKPTRSHTPHTPAHWQRRLR